MSVKGRAKLMLFFQIILISIDACTAKGGSKPVEPAAVYVDDGGPVPSKWQMFGIGVAVGVAVGIGVTLLVLCILTRYVKKWNSKSNNKHREHKKVADHHSTQSHHERDHHQHDSTGSGDSVR